MMLCPFCKTPPAESDEEEVRRVNNLIDRGNEYAIYVLAGYYDRGIMGMPQDKAKAEGLYLKAGELGCADGYFNLGNTYREGLGVTIDLKKS